MKGRVAPLWLVGLVAVAATFTLIHNTRVRVRPLTQLEYAEWVDGKVYSMASWRFWDDMYVAVS